MPKFVLIYRNANPPASPQEGQQHMQDWRAWSSGLGEAMIEPGMPFKQTLVVSSDGVSESIGANALNGVSIVEAADYNAAQSMAQACPHLKLGGDIVIAEGMDMAM